MAALAHMASASPNPISFVPSKTKTLPFSFPRPPFAVKTLNPKSIFKTLSPIRSKTAIAASSSSSAPSLKSRLRGGEALYGLFLLSFSPTLAEIAGLAGYDFVVVDMEHGPGGISDALSCLRALAAARTAAILRLPESCPVWAKKALDLGPQGLMFPMIESAKAAKRAVSYCRFPPAGVRGSAHPVVRASGYGTDEGYVGNYENDLLIMCQVESADGVDKVRDIADVDGVDCVQMGPLDLSASLGCLGDPGHRKVRDHMGVAEKAVLDSRTQKRGGGGGGAFLGGFAMPHDAPEEMRARGYHMVAGAVDVGLFRRAAVEDVRRFKAGGSGDGDGVVDGRDSD